MPRGGQAGLVRILHILVAGLLNWFMEISTGRCMSSKIEGRTTTPNPGNDGQSRLVCYYQPSRHDILVCLDLKTYINPVPTPNERRFVQNHLVPVLAQRICSSAFSRLETDGTPEPYVNLNLSSLLTIESRWADARHSVLGILVACVSLLSLD